MIIVRAPLRISFFGGGTDHPVWFKGEGSGQGAVLSTSIDKYIYLTLRRLPPIFDFKYRVAWRLVEQVNAIDEIAHPVVREVLRHFVANDTCGYEVSFNSDLPARSGLGSSSAFTVAALHAMSVHCGVSLERKALCREAIMIEQDRLNEPVGCQDQIAVGYGGFNRIEFMPDGDFSVQPLKVSQDRRRKFEENLMLYFTGFTRDAGNIEKAKFETITPQKAKSLSQLYSLVSHAQRLIESERSDLGEIGQMLHEGWVAKRSLSASVSNERIDQIYQCAMQNGAYGGKLLGAGGGGFLLFFVPIENQESVRFALSKLGAGVVEVPVKMETEGSRVVLHQPDYDSSHLYSRGSALIDAT